MTNFNDWLDLLLDEKGIDLEKIFDVEGESGNNMIPIGCVVEWMKTQPTENKAAAKEILVQIDFRNGDIEHFLRHLAQGLAI